MAENQITTKFVADAEGFINAVKKIDNSLTVLQSQLRANKTEFDKNGDAVGSLSSRNNLLSKKIELLQSKLNTLTTALSMEDLNTKKNVNTKKKFENQISKTIGKLIETQAEYNKNSRVLDEYAEKQRQANGATEQAAEDMKLLTYNADETNNSVKKIDISSLKEKIKSVASGIKDAFKKITEFAGNVLNSFKKIEQGLINLGKSSLNLGKKLKTNFIDKAIDYSEELNLFNVIFQNIEKNGETMFSELGLKATQFQNELNETFGTNKMETMRYQGLYQSMSQSAGLSKESAYVISENMTKLGYDLASLFNTSEKKAMEALRAGVFAGQTKPLRGYGIDVTQQTYKPVLADLGIDKKVSELSQAEKEVLRYIVAIRQATAAQGDFADTIEAPANQLKVLKQQMTEIAVAVGKFLITPFQRALQVINGVVMALKAVINFFADFFGITNKQYNAGYTYNDSLEDYSDGLDSVGDSASNTTKKIKELNRQTLAFDQINNINSPQNNGSSGSSGTGGGNYGIDDRLLAALGGYENQMGKVKMKAVEIRDTIMEWLGFTKEVDEKTKEVHWTYDTIGKDLPTILEEIGTNAGKGLNKLTESIDWAGYGQKLATGLNSAFALVNSFVQTYDWKKLGNDIADFVNNAISNTNWEGLGQILTNKFRIAILSLSGFLEKFDFKEFASGLARMINGAIKNIPVEDLVSGINSLVNGIFEAIKTLMKEIDWGALLDSIMTIVKGLDWKAKLLILAPILAKGISALFNSSLVKTAISKGTGKLMDKIFGGTGDIASGAGGLGSKLNNIDLKGIGKGLLALGEVILGLEAIVIAAGAVMKIPYFEDFANEGIQMLSKVFATLADMIVPLTAFALGAYGLGKLGAEAAEAIGIGLLALTAVITGLTAIVMLMGALTASKEAQDLINGGGELLIKLAEILGEFVGTLGGAIVKGFSEQLFKTLDSFGEHLSLFMTNAKPFFENAKLIDEGVTGGIKNLVTACLLITAQQFLDNIAGFLNWGRSSLETFGKQLPAFGKYLSEFSDNVKGVNGAVVTASANSAKALAELANIIPYQGGLSGLLKGEKSLATFGSQLPSFGTNLKKYSDNVNGLSTEVVSASANAAKALAEVATIVPYQGGLAGLLNGQKSLVVFGQQLPEFGTHLKEYAENVAGIDTEVITSSANSAKAIAELANSVPKSQSLLSKIFSGDNSLSAFGWQVANFGYYLRDYSGFIANFNSAKASETNGIVKDILDLFERSDDLGVKTLASNLKKGLKTYTDTIKDFLDESFKSSQIPTSGKGRTGYSMGQNIGTNIKDGIKNKLKDISIKVTDSSGKSVSTFTIKAYANGGLPEMGQLFFANEAGPEMVGRIGNRTAVANNDQIVTAIRGGVYDAVSNAIKNTGFGAVDIQLHTDEGVVVDRINRITRQTGTCPINI